MTDNPTSTPLVWDIDQTHPELSPLLKEALREVRDPELNYDIIQLGLVRNVTIAEGAAVIHMLLTTPFCPYGPVLLDKAREQAEKVLCIPVTMDLIFEPWDFSMLEEDLRDTWGF